MTTSKQRRQKVVDNYASIIGRNIYNQNLRDYCFKKYKDGKYYSDCSSSISYSYKEAGDNFGILNTAGMYDSNKLTFVDAIIRNGIIQNPEILRPGDMLLFAGSDSSRPKKIGHVEMVHHKDSNGNWIISGHGSGVPSYKNMDAYCKTRYSSWASGGWRKGLVCVKRFIQDDDSENKSGWYKEDGGWRFYLGDTGNYVKMTGIRTLQAVGVGLTQLVMPFQIHGMNTKEIGSGLDQTAICTPVNGLRIKAISTIFLLTVQWQNLLT